MSEFEKQIISEAKESGMPDSEIKSWMKEI